MKAFRTIEVRQDGEELPANVKRVISINVDYDLGGFSLSSYTPKKRGYYLSVQPEKVELREMDGVKYEIRSFMGFSGYRMFLIETQRRSAKAEQRAKAEAFQHIRPMVERVMREQGYSYVDEDAAEAIFQEAGATANAELAF